MQRYDNFQKCGIVSAIFMKKRGIVSSVCPYFSKTIIFCLCRKIKKVWLPQHLQRFIESDGIVEGEAAIGGAA